MQRDGCWTEERVLKQWIQKLQRARPFAPDFKDEQTNSIVRVFFLSFGPVAQPCELWKGGPVSCFHDQDHKAMSFDVASSSG